VNPEIVSLLDAVASDEPVPGGGSVSALAGAQAAALGTMVLRLTAAKGGGDYGPGELDQALEELAGLRAALLAGFDYDAAAYQAVVTAYRLPRASDEERQARERAAEAALQGATRVPLETARQAAAVLARCAEAVSRGFSQAVTDAGVGVALAHAAVTGALYNVEMNTRDLGDRLFVASVLAEASELQAQSDAGRSAADVEVRRRLHE
jgi:formiminotetrahydrofolate cyclodeaminase